ncbi:MAG TPA: sulfotransferase [Rhizomicrobium sp.]|nr:sulfotransferase [Rhizomicrobium sp.]
MSRESGPQAPQAPPRIYLDIDAAMRRGDTDAAIRMARQALDRGLRHPVIFNLRAYWHETNGRYAAACADLEQALALSPGDSRLLNELGRCRSGNGDYAKAVEACRAATAREPEFAPAHYNMGFALEQLGELDLAWEAYQRSRTLDPGLVDATARLAGLAARRGDRAEARALAEQVLARDPRHAVAVFSHVMADLAEGNFAEAERRARAVAADPATAAQARISAMNFVADALDGQGRPDEAFALYAEANRELKALFRNRYEGSGRETGRQIAQRLAREFDALPAQSWTPPASPHPRVGDAAGFVFLMGFPRAGTTLLGQILAGHPQVVTIEEKPLLGAALTEFILKPGGLSRLAALPEDEIRAQRELFWRAIRNETESTAGKLIVDQTPLNSLHLPVIAKLLPEAKAVFALRDPRDVVLSCFRRLFGLNAYVYEFLSLDGTATFYDETMRLAARFRDRLALPVLEVRNEDVVADFRKQARALCDFLGLEYDAAMQEFAAAARSRRIATPSAMQVTRGISSEGIGHWRAYEKQLAGVMPIIAPWVERFGYA